jgi:hypothetical protein
MITKEAKLNAVNAAIRRVCGTWNYNGIRVANLITDDEYDQISYAVVSALDDLEAIPAKANPLSPQKPGDI